MGNQRQAEIRVSDKIDENQAELLYAWAAGFFDGEGSVSICKTHQVGRNRDTTHIYYGLKIIVTQLDQHPLHVFNETFNSTRKLQLVKGSKGLQKDYYRLTFAGPAAANALEKMLPYLTVKFALAKVGIQFQSLVLAKGSRRGRYAPRTQEETEQREILWQRLKGLQIKRRFRAAAETKLENSPSGRCDSPNSNDDKVRELTRNS